MNAVLEQLSKFGVVPVVVLNDVKDAEPLAKALCQGGLPCAEVTFRTDAAEESIRIMTEKYPEMLVGAGTVLTTEQVDRAVAAGAKFIVSPGFDPEIVDYCIEKGYHSNTGMRNAFRSSSGCKTWIKSIKILPGRTVWRSCYNQSNDSSLCWNQNHADRRNQSEKCKRILSL